MYAVSTQFHELIMSNIDLQKKDLIQSIVSLINCTRERVALTVNSELTLLYWNIGKQINEDILKNGRQIMEKQLF